MQTSKQNSSDNDDDQDYQECRSNELTDEVSSLTIYYRNRIVNY